MADPSPALELLETAFAHCRVALAGNGPLVATLFLAGLAGSLTHCVGMCGPFVLAQTGERLARVPIARYGVLSRLAGASPLPYHLGRVTTYTLLGALAGALAGSFRWLGMLPEISAGFLILAALLFMTTALGSTIPWLARLPLPAMPDVSRVVGPLRALFRNPVGLNGYLLGLALGFLPCGLIYGALAAAAASLSALTGAMALAAFALGTVPALLALALAGQIAGSRFRKLAGRLTPLVMAGNALYLAYLALRLLA